MRRNDELATLSAHLNAATARWLELAWEIREESEDLAGFLAWRCGITRREAREYLRVAEALQELPVTQAAFSRGELTFTKVRALTRVATRSSEEGLIELAWALTASQLDRALRAFRRLAPEDARETHELEFVDYHFEEDGSLYLRARLAAEDGTLLVKALEAARDRVVERRREERAANATDDDTSSAPLAPFESPRSASVEALLELADAALSSSDEHPVDRTRLVVHVDSAALTSDGRGRSELEDGPVIAPETARRLGCDADIVAQVEQDGLPLSVGRKRRTVPSTLRRLLEARNDEACCFPGCERRRHLQRTTATTGRTAARRASRTSCSSASTITDWCTKVATRSRPTPRAAFASGTGMAWSARTRHRDLRPAVRTSFVPRTSGESSRSGRTPIETAATAGNASNSGTRSRLSRVRSADPGTVNLTKPSLREIRRRPERRDSL